VSDCPHAGLSRFFLKDISILMVLSLGWTLNKISLAPELLLSELKALLSFLPLFTCQSAPFPLVK